LFDAVNTTRIKYLVAERCWPIAEFNAKVKIFKQADALMGEEAIKKR